MKRVSVRQLRDDFAQVSKWLAQGETIQITKRGKPFARLYPEAGARTFLGACETSIALPPDLDQPVGIPWEAGE